MVVQDFHISAVQFLFQLLDESLGVLRNVRSLGNVSAYIFVRILDRAFFPRMVRVAEVNLHPDQTLQFFVLLKQDIIIGADSVQFGKSLLDALKRLMNVLYAHLENLFKKAHSDGAASKSQDDAASAPARYDEVCLGISYPLPFLYVFWPLVNEGAVLKLGDFGSFPAPSALLFPLYPVPLDPAAVDAPDISADAIFGYRGQVFFMRSNPSCDRLRRLVAIQVFVYESAEFSLPHNLHPLIFCLLPAHICFVVRFLWII